MIKVKNTIFAIVLLLFFADCHTPITSTPEPAKPKITLITKTDLEIDSIAFAKPSGIRAKDYYDYSDTIRIYDTINISNKYDIHYYVDGERKWEQLWLEGNDIVIKTFVDSIIKLDTVINSPFTYYTKGVIDKYYYDLLENSYEDSIVNEFLLTELKKNLDHPFSIDLSKMFLYENQDKRKNLEVLYEIIKDQNQKIKQHRSSPHERLEKIINTKAVRLTDYEFYDSSEKVATVNLPKDKKYILDFWFTGCPPCLNDHQIMKTKMDYFEKNNFEVLGISTDYDLETWANFIQQKKYPWINYKENEAVAKILSKDLGIQSYPTYIVIDQEGEILERKKTFADLMEFIAL